MPTLARHQCFVYAGPPSRNLPAVAAVIQQQLLEHRRCLYLDSPPMVAGMRSYLAAIGVDLAAETARGSLVMSSDQGHLEDGKFDIERMMQTLSDSLRDALSDGYGGLWAAGDMTWEFGQHRDFSKLLEYEWTLEQFIRDNALLSGICLYHADTLPREAMLQGLTTHASLFINETLSRMNRYFVPPAAFTDQFARKAELEAALDQLCSAPKPN